MAESFLEAQLRRIRALTERMSQLQAYAAEFRVPRVGEMSVAGNPLYDARDYRLLSSLDDDREEKESARAAHAESPRRRRRRRR